jgi:hypothetical protein
MFGVTDGAGTNQSSGKEVSLRAAPGTNQSSIPPEASNAFSGSSGI